MKKKNYLIYVATVFVLFLVGIIIWPTQDVNINIGDFHYHKTWKGPNPSDLYWEESDRTFDVKLGMVFEGGSEYKMKVIFPQTEEQLEGTDLFNKQYDLTKKTATIIQNRLTEAGYEEGGVWVEPHADAMYIYIQVPSSVEKFQQNKNVLTGKGTFEIWGQKSEEEMAAAGDQGIEIGGDGNIEVDPFRQFIQQQYNNLGVNANNIKGYKVGKSEGGYFLQIGLEDVESEKITAEIYAYFNRSLTGLLDSQMVPLDGSALGDQLSLYGQIKTVNFVALQNKEHAQLIGAVISNGPLEVTLQEEEAIDIEPLLGRDFLKKSLYAVAGVTLSFVIVVLIFFRERSFHTFITTGIFYSLVLVGLKIFPLVISLAGFYGLILGFGLFIGFQLFLIRKAVFIKGEGSIRMILPSIQSNLVRRFLLILAVFSGLCLVILPAPFRSFSGIILLCCVISWGCVFGVTHLISQIMSLTLRNR